jgi:hypothetical protein
MLDSPDSATELQQSPQFAVDWAVWPMTIRDIHDMLMRIIASATDFCVRYSDRNANERCCAEN